MEKKKPIKAYILPTVEEKMYSKEEVVNLLNRYGNYVAECFLDCLIEIDIDEDNWIKKNL